MFGNSAEGEMRRWREAWISVHDDGSVTLAAALGGHRKSDGTSTGDVIAIDALEAALADLMGLVNKTSSHITARDYDLRIGVEWAGDGPMTFEIQGGWGGDTSAVLAAYTPILASIQTDTEADDYYDTVFDLICDAVNQAGVEAPLKMSKRKKRLSTGARELAHVRRPYWTNCPPYVTDSTAHQPSARSRRRRLMGPDALANQELSAACARPGRRLPLPPEQPVHPRVRHVAVHDAVLP